MPGDGHAEDPWRRPCRRRSLRQHPPVGACWSFRARCNCRHDGDISFVFVLIEFEVDCGSRTDLGRIRLLVFGLRIVTSVGSVCRALFVVGLIALTGCTADPKGTGDDDPLEPLNRAVFATNDVLDQLGFRPAALAYNKGVPAVVRISLRNVLLWLNSPVILSNDILQGEVMNAITTAARFLINSFSFGAADNRRHNRAALPECGFQSDTGPVRHRRWPLSGSAAARPIELA